MYLLLVVAPNGAGITKPLTIQHCIEKKFAYDQAIKLAEAHKECRVYCCHIEGYYHAQHRIETFFTALE